MSSPHSLTPPPDPAAHPAWLTWLDANGLSPLAAQSIPDQDSLPLSTRIHLSAAYGVTLARWQQRSREILAVLDILAQQPAIPVIVLKGVALIVSLYPDPALRPIGDLDLLVPASSLAQAIARLRERGYRPHTLELAPGFNDSHMHHVGLSSAKSDLSLPIELHHTLPRLPNQHETSALGWLWSNIEIDQLDGQPLQVFNPTAQSLHLSMHLMRQHGGQQLRLIWVHDIDLLWRLRSGDIVWDDLLAMARMLEWDAALHQALTLCVDHFQTPLPGPVQDWLAQDPTALSGYATIRRLAAPDLTRSMGTLEGLRGRPLQAQFQVIARHLAPQPSYMRWRYRPKHPFLLPLTYPYRWLDIAADLARTGYRLAHNRFLRQP